MTKTLPLTIVLSTILCLCSNAKEPPQYRNITDNQPVAIQRIDSLFQGYDFYNRFSGTVLIAHRDSIWYQRSFGFGDFEKGIRNENGSAFGIASCTKQFTATAILKLVQEGKITLRDDLFSYFPRLGIETKKITIHHLLTHSSGISKDIGRGDSWEEIIFPKVNPISLDSLIHFFGEITLDFSPGNKFDYNNHNYVILAGIIEKVCGIDYQTFLKNTFFDPLDMGSTFFNQSKYHGELLSKPYVNLPTSYSNPDYWDDSWAIGAGGMYASANDIYVWLRELKGDGLLPHDLKSRMLESHIPDGKEFYGYGWQITEMFGNKYIYHDGGTNGYYCKIGFVPTQDIYVIILSNHTHNLMVLGNTTRHIENINNQVFNILFEQPYKKLPIQSREVQCELKGRVEINGKIFMLGPLKDKILPLQAEGDYSLFDLPFTNSLTEKSKRFDIVEKVVKAYGDHEFRTVLDNSTVVLRSLVSEKKLTEIWNDLAGETGKLITWNCYQLPSATNSDSYYVRMVYEKKEIGMQLAFKGKKINGMFTDKTFSYNGPKYVELTPIGDNNFFLDGFKFNNPDGKVYKAGDDYFLGILNQRYRISFVD